MAAGSSTLPNETVTLRLPTGEEVDGIIPGGLSDDQAKSYMQMKRPDVFGPPAGIKAPQQQPMQQVDITGKPQNPQAQFAGLPGAWGNRPTTGADLVPGAIAGGAAAAGIGGSMALPFLPKVAQAVKPYVLPALASYGISKARELPVIGPVIQHIPYAEMLPWLFSPQKPKAEGETMPPPSTDQVPGRPYQPNPRYEPTPQPEPLPPRNGQLLLKGEVQASKPTSQAALGRQLEQPLRESVGATPAPQPGIPIGMTPVQGSSAVKGFRYDPAAQEMHIMSNDGRTYVHGEVSPEQAQAFQNAPSKGQAWKDLRENSTPVGKVPQGGNRIAVKPPMKYRSATPEDQPPSQDLSGEWGKSLPFLKAKKAAASQSEAK